MKIRQMRGLVVAGTVLASTLPALLIGCGGNSSAPASASGSSGTSTTVTVSSISANPSTKTLSPGGTAQIAVTAINSDSTTATVTTGSTFASDQTSVATVSSTGLVTAVAAGTATVTSTYSGKTATTVVTVSATVTLSGITVAPSTVTLAPAGTAQIKVTASYSDSTTADVTANATFASDNSTYVTVSSTGLITAAALGSANVTSSYLGQNAVSAVTVAAAAAESYLYHGSTTPDIASTYSDWSTGTVYDAAYTGDATYSPVISLTGAGSAAGWSGTVVAFTDLTAGTLGNYAQLNFKVKTSDFTEIHVKVPETEKTYALSTGTTLSGGWVQMTVPLSDFSAVTAAATQFAIFGYSATGNLLLTDISLSGTPTTVVSTITDPTLSAATPSATTLASAVVVYSDAAASTVTISNWFELWWGPAFTVKEITLNGTDKALRYVGADAGECAALVFDPVVDVSAKTHVHMDVYAAGVGLVKLKFTSSDGDSSNAPANMQSFDVSSLQNSWQAIDWVLADIPVSGGTTQVTWSLLQKIGIILDAPMTGGDTSRIYVDNLYFY